MAIELRTLTTDLFAPVHEMLQQRAAEAAQHGDVQLRHTVDLFLDLAGWIGTVTEGRTRAAIGALVNVEPQNKEEKSVISAVVSFMSSTNTAVSAACFESYVQRAGTGSTAN